MYNDLRMPAVPGCTIGKKATAECAAPCDGTCGFHEKDRARRIAEIRAGGLEVGPDGLRRLRLPVIR